MSWDKILKACAGVLGAIAGLLGEWNMLLTVLACFMVIDYLTGLIVAWRGKSPKTESGGVSSRAGFDGLIRKFFIMVVVLVATLLDRAIGNSAAIFQTAATFYYIANEGISILENTSLMGVPYPAFIKNALDTLKDKGNQGDIPTEARPRPVPSSPDKDDAETAAEANADNASDAIANADAEELCVDDDGEPAADPTDHPPDDDILDD